MATSILVLQRSSITTRLATGFASQTSGYGTTSRNFFRGPGRTNLDLALAKATAVTERWNAEFRVEAFNVLNHTEFANPDTNVSDIGYTFGQITSTDIGLAGAHTERILQLALRLTF